MSESIIEAYKDISSLKIKSGVNKLTTIKLKEPNNAMIYYVENYVDFFTLFIGEDESEYKKLLKNRNIRLSKLKEADSHSPYYLFCQAEVILQWATIKLKFDEKFGAAKDVYEAYKLLEQNKVLFPEFAENDKSLSIIHALAESVPTWVRKIMGIKGSVSLGTKEIRRLADRAFVQNSTYKEEIIAIYSYILFYSNNKKEEAYDLYIKYQMDHRKNPLIAFLKSTMAQKIGKNDEAMQILNERPVGTEYLPFYYLDFMYGKYKLNKLEKGADVYILKFLNSFKGKHYIKEAWQKLAWYHMVIKNDNPGYLRCMANCSKFGQTLLDEDIQANNEAQLKVYPDVTMLKARLLFDGGYYSKCQNLLIVNGKKYNKSNHDGEYFYRMARVTDALKNYSDALEYYDLTITKSDPNKYFACSAALHTALIYEQMGNTITAKLYFNKCLEIDPAGYSSGLHQKAKSGLDRLN